MTSTSPDAYDGVTADDIQAYVPGFQLRTNDVDRDRTSYYLALQWQKETFRATVKYARVENAIDSLEHTTEWFPDHDGGPRVTMSDLTMNDSWSTPGIAMCNGEAAVSTAPGQSQWRRTDPGDCETMVPARGLMESGMVSSQSDAWTGAYGLGVGTLGMGKHENATTEDISLNIKWNATEKLFFEFDAQLTKADADFVEVWGGGTFFADVFVEPDLEKSDGPIRHQSAHGLSTAATRDMAVPGRLPAPTSTDGSERRVLAVCRRFFPRRHRRFECVPRRFASYEFGEDSWFKAVRFGVRYSEREQTNKEIGLNWGGIAPAWAGGYGVFSQMDTPAHELVDFSNFFRGGVVQGANNKFPYIRSDLLMNYGAIRNYIAQRAGSRDQPSLGAARQPGWNRRLSSGRYLRHHRGNAERLRAVRFRSRHRQQWHVDRWRTSASASRSRSLVERLRLRTADFNADPQTPSTRTQPRTPDAEDHDDPRDFLPETAAFLEQAATADRRRSGRHEVAAVAQREVEPERQHAGALWRQQGADASEHAGSARLAAASGANTTRPNYPRDHGPERSAVWRGSWCAGHRPQPHHASRVVIPTCSRPTAVNLDLSFEWYFQGGYFSAAVFKKDLKNIITTGDQTLGQITLDGQTVDVVYNGQINQAKADLYGFELAYQQFFDQLPGWMSHLGVQANYTNIQAAADPPGMGVDANGDGSPGRCHPGIPLRCDGSAGTVRAHRQPGRHLPGREDGVPVGLQLALGVPDHLPRLGDRQSDLHGRSGFLDGSFRYDFNEHFQISASISNILDKKEKAYHVVERGRARRRRGSRSSTTAVWSWVCDTSSELNRIGSCGRAEISSPPFSFQSAPEQEESNMKRIIGIAAFAAVLWGCAVRQPPPAARV